MTARVCDWVRVRVKLERWGGVGVETLLRAASVPAGSPSRGGCVELAHSFFSLKKSVLVSISVFMALSTVFHSIDSPNNCLLSKFVLPVLFLLYWPFQLYISL